ncbi:MAG TPA: hypothetical protein VFJ81_15815 [Gemmatimonadales bacterium]|nr:hypothetical protein [Gemmatimonadales bacterium]
MRRILILSLAFPLYLSSQAAAQTCAGMPAFSSGKMQVSGGAQFADGGDSFGANFGYGTPKSFYGKAGIGSTSYDPYNASSFDLNLGGGYQIPLHASRTAELCPVAALGLSSGPNNVLGSGVDLSSRTFSFGASVGALLGRNPQLRFVPNAAFQFANTRASVDNGTSSASDSQSYGLLTLGTGFLFNSRFSLNPSVSVPIGLTGANASFGLMGAMNFGR